MIWDKITAASRGDKVCHDLGCRAQIEGTLLHVSLNVPLGDMICEFYSMDEEVDQYQESFPLIFLKVSFSLNSSRLILPRGRLRGSAVALALPKSTGTSF